MKHKIFYGSEPTFTNADRANFSRGGYECKRLLLRGVRIIRRSDGILQWPFRQIGAPYD